MLNWLKKDELQKIATLESKLYELEQEVEFYKARLEDAKKIANSKRVVKCDNKQCIDWENGTCALPEVTLKVSRTSAGVKIVCGEVTESIADDMKEELPLSILATKIKFVDRTDKAE